MVVVLRTKSAEPQVGMSASKRDWSSGIPERYGYANVNGASWFDETYTTDSECTIDYFRIITKL